MYNGEYWVWNPKQYLLAMLYFTSILHTHVSVNASHVRPLTDPFIYPPFQLTWTPVANSLSFSLSLSLSLSHTHTHTHTVEHTHMYMCIYTNIKVDHLVSRDLPLSKTYPPFFLKYAGLSLFLGFWGARDRIDIVVRNRRSYQRLFAFHISLGPVGWGGKIHRLHLSRRVRLPHRMWHLRIWWWDFKNARAMGDAEYPLIAIAPGSTLALSGSTW